MFCINEIKNYWDEQARTMGASANATTQDVYMRKIEINYISNFLSSFRKPMRILDIGCGNGYSTIKIKENVEWHIYIGGDYSEEMIRVACFELEKKNLKENIEFRVMDVLKLSDYGINFDIIISDRCLINLGNSNNRKTALWEIAKCLSPGGYYLMIENFIEGHLEMNRMRGYLDLPEIPIRWHNSFFSKRELMDSVKNIFRIDRMENISSLYYLVTRVVYSKLCESKGKIPNYEHLINQVAVNLPPYGELGPIYACLLIRR